MSRAWIWNGKWKIISISVIAGWCVICAWFLLRVFTGGFSVQPALPNSQIAMRGCTIITLRLNNTTMPQQISVCDDGVAARSSNPPEPALWTHYRLTTNEYTELLALRTQWCAQQPTFHMLGRNARSYDFGVRCTESYHVTQFSIPEQELPAVLTAINRHLPPLPSP